MSADELFHVHHQLRGRLERAYAAARWDQTVIDSIADELSRIERTLQRLPESRKWRPNRLSADARC
jgi:hypothetical protein